MLFSQTGVWTACWLFLPNYPSSYDFSLPFFVYTGWETFGFLPFSFPFSGFRFAFKTSLCFKSSKWASKYLFKQMKITWIFELSLFMPSQARIRLHLSFLFLQRKLLSSLGEFKSEVFPGRVLLREILRKFSRLLVFFFSVGRFRPCF